MFNRNLWIWVLFFCCLTGKHSERLSAQNANRVDRGLQVLYDFRKAHGNIIHDRAGAGPPINLRIEDMRQVRRSEGELRIVGKTVIRSQRPAKRLVEAIRRSGSITIEAWIRPTGLNQTGPARVVTLSKDANERNFTLGQEGNRIDVRFRTTKTSDNGLPSLRSAGKSLREKTTHVVYTCDRSGNARLYLDGRLVEKKSLGGKMNQWNESYQLGLANEVKGDRPWRGTLYRVAIYDRQFEPSEVERNHRVGAKAETSKQLAAKQPSGGERFESHIAPLLSRHCLECHDSISKQGDLDLSRKTAAFRGGESGKAIVPGKSSESLVWESVREDVMPEDRPPLSTDEKRLIREWIDSGAAWPVDYVDPAIYRNVSDDQNWVQRLTMPEYIETVRATLNVDIADQARKILPPDNRADGFRNTAYNLNVDLQHVDSYAQLAEIIVSKLDVEALATRFSKSKRLTDDHMRDLIAKLGKWVLRGPLDEQEVVVYRGISTTVASAGGDFHEAVGLIVEAMLQSPRFLYRIEHQIGDGSREPAGGYELACRISYILWGAPPDKELYRAAESGDLADADEIRAQIERMLQDRRAVERSKQFVTEWLDLDRLDNMRPDIAKFPNWKHELASDMRVETIAFFEDLVWKQNRPLTELLSAQFTFLTPQLAEHYGLRPQSNELARYELGETPSRGGLLTHGSVLTMGGDDASMVTRGLFVLNDLLFSAVGDPPPGLDTTPVPTSPGRTHRAIATERIESAACGGCHSRFEPLAFGLERFDGLGSYREEDEHGNDLREDGEILFPGDSQPINYKTSAEMMELLGKSDRVGECLTRKVTQFALGRPLVAADASAIRAVHQASQRRGGTYRSLMTEIIMSELVRRTRTETRP